MRELYGQKIKSWEPHCLNTNTNESLHPLTIQKELGLSGQKAAYKGKGLCQGEGMSRCHKIAHRDIAIKKIENKNDGKLNDKNVLIKTSQIQKDAFPPTTILKDNVV